MVLGKLENFRCFCLLSPRQAAWTRDSLIVTKPKTVALDLIWSICVDTSCYYPAEVLDKDGPGLQVSPLKLIACFQRVSLSEICMFLNFPGLNFIFHCYCQFSRRSKSSWRGRRSSSVFPNVYKMQSFAKSHALFSTLQGRPFMKIRIPSILLLFPLKYWM